MKRFLVIKNETDLDRVRRLRPRLLDDATALAVSPLAVLLLRQGGHEPVTLFDYLRSVDLAAIYDDAAGAAAGWFEVLDGDLTTEERELFGCLEMDLFELFAHATAADRALDRLLSEHGRAVFHLFEPPGVACIGTMALFCRHPVTEAVIRYRAAKGEAFIEWIRPLPAMDPRRWVHGLLRRMLPTNPLRHERVLPESRKDLERSWPPRLAEAGSRDQHLLLVGNAHNLRTLFTVLASHNEGGISRISALNLDDGLPSFEERAGLSGEGEYYRLRSIPIDADQRALWKSRLWELGQRFSRLRLESPEPELANPYLEFQFDHLFSNLLPETWETFHRCRDAIAALRPDTLLIASPTRFEYAAIAAARATHVPTIFVNHGILGKIHKFGVPTDRFWAWGESSLRSARSALHWQEHQVAVVGAPQIHGAIEQVVAARREPRCARLARLDLADAGRVLLVITGGNTEGPFSLVTGDAIWNSWQAVLAWIRAHPEITVILKPHPAADLHPWYETIRAILPNLFVRRFNALEDALAVADGAVLMEHVTTAALVAVGASCPLLYVNTARRLENVYTARWTDELETVRRAAEIPLALTRLLEDADFRAMLLDRGHDFFAKNILPSERIPGALRKALSRIHAAESGGPLTASSTVV